MSHDPKYRLPRNLFRLSLVAACLLCLNAFATPAQTTPANNSANNSGNAPAAKAAATADEQPPFQEYKGVRIGMTADETRKKLGPPTDKGDAQDFYLVSNKESVQVMYDGGKKVSAIALIYMNAGDKAPTPKAVMGDEVEARPDGSVYKLVRYPKAGYWLSYSRTAGDSPIVSVTMQKMN
jgi:outer membrane protein assembly factor BamE (lipoprotein component of BamABCDE complex)